MLNRGVTASTVTSGLEAVEGIEEMTLNLPQSDFSKDRSNHSVLRASFFLFKHPPLGIKYLQTS